MCNITFKKVFKSFSSKKRVLTLTNFIFFVNGITSILAGMSNNPDYSTAHKSETYAAGIALVKSGTVVGGCDAIEFTYTVTNESTLGEVLENVVVSDPIFGDLAGPDSGDDNNNTFLDPGETWIYVANHNITQTDINNGQVVGQANVNADVQGQPGVTVMDLSDDDSPLEDDTTIIDLSSCPNISVIKKVPLWMV